jgi:hypothetical protein
LSGLLSRALVAFTIEADNEAEHRMPHRTTSQGRSAGAPGPWLVSLVMWENWLAGPGPAALVAAALPDGPAPRRLPGRQLTRAWAPDEQVY